MDRAVPSLAFPSSGRRHGFVSKASAERQRRLRGHRRLRPSFLQVGLSSLVKVLQTLPGFERLWRECSTSIRDRRREWKPVYGRSRTIPQIVEQFEEQSRKRKPFVLAGGHQRRRSKPFTIVRLPCRRLRGRGFGLLLEEEPLATKLPDSGARHSCLRSCWRSRGPFSRPSPMTLTPSRDLLSQLRPNSYPKPTSISIHQEMLLAERLCSLKEQALKRAKRLRKSCGRSRCFQSVSGSCPPSVIPVVAQLVRTSKPAAGAHAGRHYASA